jgi:hypothetical protein
MDIEAARRDGYTDAEIADELAKRHNFPIEKARADGHSDADIVGELAKRQLAKTPGTKTEKRGRFTIDVTPFNVEPQNARRFVKGEPIESVDNRYDIDLAKKGILRDKPGEGALDLKDYQDISYYSAGPEYARTYIGRKVKEKLAPNSDYDPSELTRVVDGKVQYLDISKPVARWKEVDTGVLYSFGKPAMWGEMGTDLALGTAATVASGALSPAGGVAVGGATSGANAFAWRRAALRKGREMGINEGLSDEDIDTLAQGYGMIVGGTATLFGAPMAWSRVSPKNSLFSRDTATGILDDFDTNMASSAKTADDVNALRPGADEQFNPTVPQRSGISEVKDTEATIEAQHAGAGTQKIASEVRDQKSRNTRVLSLLWDELFPKSKNTIDDIEQAGLDIQAEAYARAGQSQEAQAQKGVVAGRRKISKELDNIDENLDYDQLITELRGVESPGGNISGTKFYELQDKVASQQAALTQAVEQNGRNVTVHISDKNLLLQPLLEMRARLSRGVPSLNAAVGDTTVVAHIDGLLELIRKNGGEVPFALVDDVHTKLGRHIGNIQRAPAKGVDTPDVSYLANIASILEEAIVKMSHTGPTPARDTVELWLKRKEMTTLRHDIFDRKAVRDVLATGDPDGLTGKQVFNNIFTPESAKYLERLVEIVGSDEESMNALRKVALKKYKDSVSRNGEVSLNAHNQFVNKFRRHLEVLFPEGTPITKMGAMEEAVAKQEVRAKALAKAHSEAWYNVFGSKFKYSPHRLVRDMSDLKMDKGSYSQLISHLEKTDPALVKLIQEEAVSQLRVRFGADKLPSAEALSKFLTSTKARNFQRLMGAQGGDYLRNLGTLRDALLLNSQQGVSKGTPSTNLLTTATRAAFGPLHRVQRFITAGRQAYSWMSAKDAHAVISDPARLRRALQYAAMAPSLKAVPAAIASDIGALGAMFYEQETR